MSTNDPALFMRRALVNSLKHKGELDDPRVEAAFMAVPRHAFLPDVALEQAYADEAVPVKREPDGTVVSSASQPSMMAMMLRQLQLRPGDNVLEIGTGTGYNAALMQHIVGETGTVTTVEYDPEVAETARNNLQRIAAGSIRVVTGDGASGYAPRAAYDRIIATVGLWDIPAAWERQLKPDGIIVAPLWLDAIQVSAAFHPLPDGALYSENNLPCGFIRLRGAYAGPLVTRRVGTGLLLTTSAAALLDSAALHLLFSEDAEPGVFDIRLSAGQYWQGFLSYLVLNIPPGYAFAAYQVVNNQPAYGIPGPGFALIGPGCACFVTYEGHGEAFVFAGPDAFLALQNALQTWDALGRPGARQLRLRLMPLTKAPPEVATGAVYARKDHYLHAWQDYDHA
ncbi:MAG: methyltransferase domain-containing protein [Aggregatilineales bacterium]